MGVHGKKGRSGGDPGKIHRSRVFGVQECWRRGEDVGTGMLKDEGKWERGRVRARVSERES